MALMGNQNISFGLSFEERKTDKEGRREEKEKKKKKKRRKKKEFKEDQRYGIVWNLTLSMDYLNFLYGYMFVGCGL